MSLWVVVPAYNEAARINDTLDRLAGQTDRDFTLVVVDNASTDSTAEVVSAFAAAAPLPVHLVREDEKGIGSAVDTGFRYAIAGGATLLARTDADCLPDPGWVAAIRSAFAGGAAMAYGRLRARRDENGLVARAAFRVLVGVAAAAAPLRPANRGTGEHLAPYRLHAGNNMAITADLYLAMGGMPRDESVATDRILFDRVRRHTAAVRRCRPMLVENSTRRLRAYGVVGTALWYLDRGSGGRDEDPR
jgi:glycosyltransferase involved in cell wall biosynthesis